MDPVTYVTDKLKGFLKSSEEVFHRREKSGRYKPIEILKRLQREAFSDIMKLRDRQEKVERMLTFYKSTKGSPFQDLGTHIQGRVDLAGALLFVDNADEESRDALERSRMTTGINSQFTFETTIRQKDSLVAELVACQNNQGPPDELLGSPLSLRKVMYSANVNDWFSSVVVPWGARCKDLAITSNHMQERKLTDFSSFGPPVLNQCHGAAMGLMVKRSKIAASLAVLASENGWHPDSPGISHCLGTFGQIIYQISKGTTASLLGLHKRVSVPSQQVRLPKYTISLGSLRGHAVHASEDTDASPDKDAYGSMALMLESILDESTRVGGWVEMQNSNPRCLQWSVSMSDTPEDELGWGLSLGGIVQGPLTWDHFQAEAFLKVNMGKRCSLQPGLVYVMDGTKRIPALMFRSTWSL